MEWRVMEKASMRMERRIESGLKSGGGVMGLRPRRARFRVSTWVALHPMKVGAGRYWGRLLNVSAEGLACQIEAEAAPAFESGPLWVETDFHLEGTDRRYRLIARVIYAVPAQTPGFHRLGLQFVHRAPEPAAQTCLRDELRRLQQDSRDPASS